MNSIKSILGIFIALGFAVALPLSAEAETTQCTVITSLPYTITTQGVYCLKSDLATAITSGNAITINANNVTIDLNGYKIGGLAAGAGTQAIGIYAWQRKNITIKNGIVRGFYYGIVLSDTSPYTASQGNLVEDIRADLNTTTAIEIGGSGNTVRNCNVVSTGGSTHANGANAIESFGPGGEIYNNAVIETVGPTGGSAVGIYISGNGDWVSNNHIANAAVVPTTIGILIVSGYSAIADNNIVDFDYGVYYATSTGGIYRDNLVSGATTAYTNGTAAGTTNYSIP